MKYDDSKTESKYFTLDLTTWEEIENHWLEKNKVHIGVGKVHGLNDVKMFI